MKVEGMRGLMVRISGLKGVKGLKVCFGGFEILGFVEGVDLVLDFNKIEFVFWKSEWKLGHKRWTWCAWDLMR